MKTTVSPQLSPFYHPKIWTDNLDGFIAVKNGDVRIPRCSDCRHWGPETFPWRDTKTGFGQCAAIPDQGGVKGNPEQYPDADLVQIAGGFDDVVVHLRTKPDFACVLFEPKQ
jgi:hypothetical protein